MSPKVRFLSIAFAALLSDATSLAYAAKLSRAAADFAEIDDGAGHSRLLLQWDASPGDDFIAVSRAILTFELAGAAEARALSLRAYPVTSTWDAATVDWSRGWTRVGGDFDEEAMAPMDVDLSSAGGAVVVDVTDAVKSRLEDGEEFHGLLVTCDPAEGVGMRTEDAVRFTGLTNASIELTYRRIPAPPRELAGQDSSIVR